MGDAGERCGISDGTRENPPNGIRDAERRVTTESGPLFLTENESKNRSESVFFKIFFYLTA